MKSYKTESSERLTSFEEILRAALDLPPSGRAMLAGHLLESLDGSEQTEVDAAWAEEIERRIRDIDEGRVELIPGEEVLAELRSRFK
ncbi:MAG TPA: addiction module protein [Pyrinomonadaceae bacterium]|nr:addiction module protein [Pyrinomonadaceae bacterium]